MACLVLARLAAQALGREPDFVPFLECQFQGMGVIRTFLLSNSIADAQKLLKLNAVEELARVASQSNAGGLQILSLLNGVPLAGAGYSANFARASSYMSGVSTQTGVAWLPGWRRSMSNAHDTAAADEVSHLSKGEPTCAVIRCCQGSVCDMGMLIGSLRCRECQRHVQHPEAEGSWTPKACQALPTGDHGKHSICSWGQLREMFREIDRESM
jgi:hypothetical protein